MLFSIIGYMFGFWYMCVAFPWACWSTHWSKNVGRGLYLHAANQLLCHVTQGLLLLTQMIFLKLIVFLVSAHSSLSMDSCLVLIKAPYLLEPLDWVYFDLMLLQCHAWQQR